MYDTRIKHQPLKRQNVAYAAILAKGPALNGTVIKLDRGFPLVRCADGTLVRCEHSAALAKDGENRAVIGDVVSISLPSGHDKGLIDSIGKRRTEFVRRDPAQRTARQVLAANFDLVVIAEPLVQLNRNRLERELVLAHQTGADVAVVLTKADLAEDEIHAQVVRDEVSALAGRLVSVLVMSIEDEASVQAVRELLLPDKVAILIGKSGVGKSSLVNVLAKTPIQDIGEVRERDGKGRHTTVDRVMVSIPGGGCVVDMPGVRGLGLWDADEGLGTAFPDIDELARQCRFRDCKHTDEPGCAVLAAVETGELAQARLNSYRGLASELEDVRVKREEARHLRGEKASDRKKSSRQRKRR